MRTLLCACAAAAAFFCSMTPVAAMSPQAPAPGGQEPARDEPVKDEPVKDEPVKGEPAKDEPAKDEPAKGPGRGTSSPKDDGKDAHGAWITSYEDALARAKKEKKLILADFTGSDWCGWCIKLKDEVFSKPEFEKWAAKNVVLLELDFPRKKELPKELKEQNDKLRDEHKIRGYPTILFLDAKGKKVGQMGYEAGGPENWVKKAEKVVKKAKGR